MTNGRLPGIWVFSCSRALFMLPGAHGRCKNNRLVQTPSLSRFRRDSRRHRLASATVTTGNPLSVLFVYVHSCALANHRRSNDVHRCATSAYVCIGSGCYPNPDLCLTLVQNDDLLRSVDIDETFGKESASEFQWAHPTSCFAIKPPETNARFGQCLRLSFDVR